MIYPISLVLMVGFLFCYFIQNTREGANTCVIFYLAAVCPELITELLGVDGISYYFLCILSESIAMLFISLGFNKVKLQCHIALALTALIGANICGTLFYRFDVPVYLNNIIYDLAGVSLIDIFGNYYLYALAVLAIYSYALISMIIFRGGHMYGDFNLLASFRSLYKTVHSRIKDA